MDVKLWVAEAPSGTVLGTLPAVGDTALSMRLGGGSIRATIPLGHLLKRDGTPDLQAAKHYLDLCAPGARTIVATTGTTVLGEWLIMGRTRSIVEGTVGVTGVEWDAYPVQRQVHTDRELSGDLTGVLARTFLQDLYSGQNGNIAVSVPSTNCGTTGTIQERKRTRYYADVLAELAGQSPGFEWRVTLTGTWAGESLTKVTRAVRFGSPVLAYGAVLQVQVPEPGSRAGAVVEMTTDESFERQASAVYVVGAGDGAKRVVGAYSDGSGRAANGWVSRTRLHSMPDVASQVVADRLARKISDQSQSLWGAAPLTLLADKLPSLPSVGSLISVSVPPAWVFPEGLSQRMRIGEVSMSVQGGYVDMIRVQAAEE